jgi:serine phosphatase RsbU (regulator of sigma subunit)
LLGAAFSRDLPGQSRLKTAPTIKNNRFKTTKFLFRSDWTLAASGGACMKHSSDGTLQLLKKGGRPLGTIDLLLSDDEPIVYEEEHEQLGPGDKLIFYTDGVHEYQNAKGEFYGNDRFFSRLKELKDQTVDGLVETVFESLMIFGNNTEPKDDVSLLGIELKT